MTKKRYALLTAAAVAFAIPSICMADGCDIPTQICIVSVTVTGSVVKFTPDKLHVKESEIGTPYRIIVKLPGGYMYKTAQGDGVFFKDPDKDEFYDNYVSDSDLGLPSASPRGWRRYTWKFVNSFKGTYHYKVLFHDAAGNPFMGDPLITNIDAN